MKKKILTFLCFIFMTFGMFTGCSGFVDDESLVITNITTQVLEDGRTMVVITYEDEEVQPAIFYIPKGEDGIQGVQGDGIKEITYELNDNGDYVLKVTFTNPEIDPVEFIVKNGVSISGIETFVNEKDGETYFVIKYSNGTSSEPMMIPKGEDGKNGKDGSTIIAYTNTINDDGSVTLSFYFSTGEMYTCDIPAPQKGETGRGIKAIISSEDEENYYLTIEYTDDSEPETFSFAKPTPNTWHRGEGTPGTSIGKDGDYYFDIKSNDIYTKIDGAWFLIIDFEDSETLCTVTFDLNSDDAFFPEGFGYSKYYTIPKGSNFASCGTAVPIPVRNGYVFNGWYTTQSPSVVNGSFNDLTTVASNLKLYANWIEK